MGVFGNKCVRCGKSLPYGQPGLDRTCAECARHTKYDPQAERRCPGDGSRMSREVVWDIVVDGCPVCHKMWVDGSEISSPSEVLGAAV